MTDTADTRTADTRAAELSPPLIALHAHQVAVAGAPPPLRLAAVRAAVGYLWSVTATADLDAPIDLDRALGWQQLTEGVARIADAVDDLTDAVDDLTDPAMTGRPPVLLTAPRLAPHTVADLDAALDAVRGLLGALTRALHAESASYAAHARHSDTGDGRPALLAALAGRTAERASRIGVP